MKPRCDMELDESLKKMNKNFSRRRRERKSIMAERVVV